MAFRKAIAFAVAAAGLLTVNSAAQGAAFTNGSFEINTCGTAAGTFTTVGPVSQASSCITGWAVVPHSVDLVRENYWEAQDGEYSIDLSGGAPGGVEQTFDTNPGGLYSVDYYLAGNPEANNGDGPLKFGLVAAIDGAVIDSATFLGVANTKQNMQYLPWNFTFTAQGTSTTLRFTSRADNDAWGPVLDNVSVTAIPEPAAWAMMLIGFGVVGRSLRQRRRRNPYALQAA